MDANNLEYITNLSGNALAIAILFFFIRYFINREEKREAMYIEREEKLEARFNAQEEKRDQYFGKLIEENTKAINALSAAVRGTK